MTDLPPIGRETGLYFLLPLFSSILYHRYTTSVHTLNSGLSLRNIVSLNRFTSVPKAKTAGRGKASNNFLPSSTFGPVWVVPHEETMRTVKLVVIGSSGVGKTSLRSQVRP